MHRPNLHFAVSPTSPTLAEHWVNIGPINQPNNGKTGHVHFANIGHATNCNQWNIISTREKCFCTIFHRWVNSGPTSTQQCKGCDHFTNVGLMLAWGCHNDISCTHISDTALHSTTTPGPFWPFPNLLANGSQIHSLPLRQFPQGLPTLLSPLPN